MRQLLVLCLLTAWAGDSLSRDTEGGNWDLAWWTVDGGGEMVTAGAGDGEGMELSGTLGQWDAAEVAPLQGGAWELNGGFWGVNLETDVIFQDGFEG